MPLKDTARLIWHVAAEGGNASAGIAELVGLHPGLHRRAPQPLSRPDHWAGTGGTEIPRFG